MGTENSIRGARIALDPTVAHGPTTEKPRRAPVTTISPTSPDPARHRSVSIGRPPAPAHQRVRRHDRCDSAQRPSARSFALAASRRRWSSVRRDRRPRICENASTVTVGRPPVPWSQPAAVLRGRPNFVASERSPAQRISSRSRGSQLSWRRGIPPFSSPRRVRYGLDRIAGAAPLAIKLRVFPIHCRQPPPANVGGIKLKVIEIAARHHAQADRLRRDTCASSLQIRSRIEREARTRSIGGVRARRSQFSNFHCNHL